MKIKLKRQNDAYHVRAENETGQTLDLDANPELGGEDKGLRPMQAVLAALGGCSTIDVVSILKKQHQPVEDLEINIEAEREQDVTPALFTKIHIHFELQGDLDSSKVERAVDLSMDKYCSVAKIVEKTAEITYSFEIKP
ncbi:MAG: OsmC family protein [Bacteroidota bacterium]